MGAILTFFVRFFTESQDTNNIKVPLFIVVLIILLIALGVSVILSRKNRLYIKTDTKDEVIKLHGENEVA